MQDIYRARLWWYEWNYWECDEVFDDIDFTIQEWYIIGIEKELDEITIAIIRRELKEMNI